MDRKSGTEFLSTSQVTLDIELDEEGEDFNVSNVLEHLKVVGIECTVTPRDICWG